MANLEFLPACLLAFEPLSFDSNMPALATPTEPYIQFESALDANIDGRCCCDYLGCGFTAPAGSLKMRKHKRDVHGEQPFACGAFLILIINHRRP